MTRFPDMPEDLKLKLFTSAGEFVTDVADPVAAMMAVNGSQPELVMWGQRFFIHADGMNYREVFCTVVGLAEAQSSGPH